MSRWTILKYESTGQLGTPEFHEVGIAINGTDHLVARWEYRAEAGPERGGGLCVGYPTEFEPLFKDQLSGTRPMTRAEVYRRMLVMGFDPNFLFSVTSDDPTIPNGPLHDWKWAPNAEAAKAAWGEGRDS